MRRPFRAMATALADRSRAGRPPSPRAGRAAGWRRSAPDRAPRGRSHGRPRRGYVRHRPGRPGPRRPPLGRRVHAAGARRGARPRLVARAVATGGNPFYVTELVGALQATGALTVGWPSATTSSGRHRRRRPPRPAQVHPPAHRPHARRLRAAPLELAEHFLRARPGRRHGARLPAAGRRPGHPAGATIAAELLERAAELFDAADPDGDSLLADWTISVEALGRVREPPVTEAKLRLCLARMLMRRGRSDDAARHCHPAQQIEGIDHAAPLAHGPVSLGVVRGAAAGGCRASARMLRSWSQPTNGRAGSPSAVTTRPVGGWLVSIEMCTSPMLITLTAGGAAVMAHVGHFSPAHRARFGPGTSRRLDEGVSGGRTADSQGEPPRDLVGRGALATAFGDGRS